MKNREESHSPTQTFQLHHELLPTEKSLANNWSKLIAQNLVQSFTWYLLLMAKFRVPFSWEDSIEKDLIIYWGSSENSLLKTEDGHPAQLKTFAKVVTSNFSYASWSHIADRNFRMLPTTFNFSPSNFCLPSLPHKTQTENGLCLLVTREKQ